MWQSVKDAARFAARDGLALPTYSVACLVAFVVYSLMDEHLGRPVLLAPLSDYGASFALTAGVLGDTLASDAIVVL